MCTTIDLTHFASYNINMRIERIKLKKLDNTRDLGGFPTESGKKIKHGKLIRSGKLYKLPKDTLQTLEQLGISTIVDMRMDVERQEYPCTPIKGAKHVHLPLVCTATTGITHTKSMARTMFEESKRIKTEFGSADNYMQSVYSLLLFDEESRAKLRKFFDLVIADENCILWHCSAGKDRTGITAMLLEFVLGVDEQTIIEDYTVSEKFQRKKRILQRTGIFIAPMPKRFKQILIALMKANPQYITGAIAEIKERYGTVIEYCKQAIGLTEEEIELLRNKYLE